MANIKFSQFTVGNTESDIDFVVGYKGANNIQISPTNLLAASLSGYLPLTGGTMTGGITMVDDVGVLFGSGGDSFIKHTGTQMSMFNDVGDMYFVNRANDRNIYFQSDNGSGGTETYLFLDGNSSKTVLPDNKQIQIGSGGGDGYIYSDGTNMWIQGNNPSADIKLYQGGTDGSIRFYSDNGSGGVAEYFAVDGGEEQVRFFKDTEHADNVKATFGNSGDLKIYHEGTDSIILNYTGSIYIDNNADDKDIVFRCDDGSGGIQEYFRLDGSNAGFTTFPDNTTLAIGTDRDFRMSHDGTDTNVWGVTGDIIFTNYADDKDIVFRSDDGSGGVTEYFRVDGSSEKIVYSRNQWLTDGVRAVFGSSDDLQVFHNATNSYIENNTGDLLLVNYADNSDIKFFSDDGSGGTTEYFRLDGGDGINYFFKDIKFLDDGRIKFGTSSDLQIYHNATNSLIENSTGDFYISNKQDDGDIIFFCDDGSGGTAQYFRLDGGIHEVIFSKSTRHMDNVKGKFGSGEDLQIYHNASDSVIENNVGDLYITNKQDDGDIIFRTDNGSGAFTEYFKLDGGSTLNVFYKPVFLGDGVKSLYGNSSDLQIYHDGSNSYIDETGTGNLFIRASAAIDFTNPSGSENIARFIENDRVELYFNGTKKLETTSTGIKITGVSEYADNTAAIAGGLTTGDVYRTGDLLKIVH